MPLRLLFITPKINERDDDLAFASLWVRAFESAGFDVIVLCGEKKETTLTCPVYSVEHEQGQGHFSSFWRSWLRIITLKYDRVFVHMNTRWLAAGAWYWLIRRIPVYLWFTHYTRTFTLRISSFVIKRMFAATRESLPQFEGDPRKIVTGHGIDTHFWNIEPFPDDQREPVTHLLAVHRISRSKRLDLVLRILAQLPPEYHLTHYGRPLDPAADQAYAKELQELIKELHLQDRVHFMGSVPMPELRSIYPRFRVFINLVPRTVDKTVLEAMYCGLTPVMIKSHAEAIGYPHAPESESPEDIARFIQSLTCESRESLQKVVKERHSLERLVEKMAEYIREGK